MNQWGERIENSSYSSEKPEQNSGFVNSWKILNHAYFKAHLFKLSQRWKANLIRLFREEYELLMALYRSYAPIRPCYPTLHGD